MHNEPDVAHQDDALAQRAQDPLAQRAQDPLAQRVQAAAPGLTPLLTAAEQAQQQRAQAARERGAPRWTDVFTTQFTEFSNRPR